MMKQPLRKQKHDDSKKLSLDHCRKVLNKNGNNYTDEQVLKIRDFLYFFAELVYEEYKRKQIEVYE